MTWRKAPIDPQAVQTLSTEFGIDLLSAAVLVRRGVHASAELPYYLETDLRYLHSPMLFEAMPDVLQRIFQARDEEERVLVFGDRDVDGITATAVMVRTLRELNIETWWEVPEGDATYGLARDAVDRHAARSGSLIVTVDCGITNGDEIDYALSLGIETIVVDHHNPHETLPPAVAIINPKVEEAYPFDGLCGCALAAKVRQALELGSTDLFGQELTLINVRPARDALIVDAIALEHGVEVDRISEALVPGVARLDATRLQPFLIGRSIVCFDAQLQTQLLSRALGTGVDIYLVDLAPELQSAFPQLARKSLPELRAGSRLLKYSGGASGEVDVLLALYQTLVRERFPVITEALLEVSDLVALATIADMMPLRNENRTIVRVGLDRIAGTQANLGLAALIAQLGLAGKRLSSRDLSWSINPAINATGRMGRPSTAVNLLLTTEEAERRQLARQIDDLNKQRRKVGEDGWQAVRLRAGESLAANAEKAIVVHEPSIHRGVTGIIAGKLARRFGVPAAVMTSVDDVAIGSVRSMRGFTATGFLAQLDDILERWGGHDEAAGFHLKVDRLPEFWRRIEQLAPRIELAAPDDGSIEVDAEVPTTYLNPDLERVVHLIEPYGSSNPQLRFLARKMVVEEVGVIGKQQNHLRLLLAGAGYKWPAVYWGAAERLGDDFGPRDRVDVVFEFSKNYFNGRETIQLVIVDLARSSEQVAEG